MSKKKLYIRDRRLFQMNVLDSELVVGSLHVARATS